MANFFDRVGNLIESGIKGVLDAPNALRELSDELGTIIYGGLETQAREFEQVARPRAEEFFASQAGAQAGRTAFRFRGLLVPVLVIGSILIGAFIISRN